MDYSFSSTAGTSQSTAKPRLAGNQIHLVELESCEIADIQGVKEPDKTFKVLKLKFSNDEGYFEKTIWEPRPEDFDRREIESKNPKTGKTEKIPQPSNVETMMLLFKHIIDSANPKIAEEIDSKKRNLGAKDWDGLRKLVAEILKNTKGIKKSLKLLKNKDGEAIIPYFSGLTREGTAYVKNNFFGDKIAFSSYEMDKIKKEANATITPMPNSGSLSSYSTSNVQESESDLDMDFDLDITGI